MMEKFKPIKTLKVTCKECGHVGSLEVSELEANAPLVNFVAKIKHEAKAQGRREIFGKLEQICAGFECSMGTHVVDQFRDEIRKLK